MLYGDQLLLLSFLKQYPAADQRTCLSILDIDDTKDWDKISYRLRPLVKHKYITRRDDGLYSLLNKGKQQTYTFIEPLITCGGDRGGRKRASKIAGIAALFEKNGIYSGDRIPPEGCNIFIPSPAWRKIREGLVSTTRFLGMLYFEKLRLAVYDIGDGHMEWQTYAERSLHFYDYGSHDTRATGILMVCDDGMGIDAGRQIIRHTMWNRKRLLKEANDYGWENPKKRPVSKSPIKLHSDYQRVYLAERSDMMEVLKIAAAEKKINDYFCKQLNLSENHDWRGMFLENHPDRYYVNLQNDLLRMAVMFKQMKNLSRNQSIIRYHVIIREKQKELARMYADLDLDICIIGEELLQWLMS